MCIRDSSNGDRLVTIKNDILADAKNISAGDELLVWYKAMTLSCLLYTSRCV